MTAGFEKVLDAVHVTWFIHGHHPSEGLVDIADREGDVLERVPSDLAEAIVESHNAAIQRIVEYMDEPENISS